MSSPPKNSSVNIASRICSTTTTIILVMAILLFGYSIYISFSNSETPNDAFLFGYKPIYVKTDTMEPTIKNGSVLMVKQTTYQNVLENDIIMYEYDEKLIVHRVADITDEGIRTKGDKTGQFDAYLLQPEHIKGKVVYICNAYADVMNMLKNEETRSQLLLKVSVIAAALATIVGIIIAIYNCVRNSRRINLHKYGERYALSMEESRKTSYILSLTLIGKDD